MHFNVPALNETVFSVNGHVGIVMIPFVKSNANVDEVADNVERLELPPVTVILLPLVVNAPNSTELSLVNPIVVPSSAVVVVHFIIPEESVIFFDPNPHDERIIFFPSVNFIVVVSARLNEFVIVISPPYNFNSVPVEVNVPIENVFDDNVIDVDESVVN